MQNLYIVIGVLIGLALLLTVATSAQTYVMNTFKRYSKGFANVNLPAETILAFLIQKEHLHRLKLARTKGFLTDFYSPKKRMIAISEANYHNPSVASVAVVSHELGHALQHNEHAFIYSLHRLANSLSRILGKLILPAILVGIILIFIESTSQIGLIILISAGGVVLLGVLGRLLTISVEYDASRRGLKLLEKYRILNTDELEDANKVLSSAGFTYIAAFILTMLGLSFLAKLH